MASKPSPEQLVQFGALLTQRVDQFRDTAYAQALRESRFGRQVRQLDMPLDIAPAEVLYDDPAKPVPPGGEVAPSSVNARIYPHVENAEREVLLISPYFIPSERSVATLIGLVRRGVRVRVLTNSLASTDVPAAYAGYARYRTTLIAGGVEIFEMRPLPDEADTRHSFGSSGASLHAKAIVVDRRLVVLGSMNLDPRSRRHNTELAVLIESAELGKRVADLFEEGVQPAHAYRVELADPNDVGAGLVWITEDDGKLVRHTSEPASFGKRLAADLLSIFAPEDLL
jgi:putative cardiolipin synthase